MSHNLRLEAIYIGSKWYIDQKILSRSGDKIFGKSRNKMTNCISQMNRLHWLLQCLTLRGLILSPVGFSEWIFENTKRIIPRLLCCNLYCYSSQNTRDMVKWMATRKYVNFFTFLGNHILEAITFEIVSASPKSYIILKEEDFLFSIMCNTSIFQLKTLSRFQNFWNV